MKRITRFIIFFICLSCIISCLNISSYATVQNDIVAVTPVIQAKSQWCWAACAVMAGKAVWSLSIRTQYDVVAHIKGTDDEPYPDVPGTLVDSVNASNFVTSSNRVFGRGNAMGFSTIAWYMQHDSPLQAAAGYYYNGVRLGGHMVVIYGTQFIDNSAGSWFNIDYIDPIDGVRHHCTYDSFCDGSYNSRIFDGSVLVGQN